MKRTALIFVLVGLFSYLAVEALVVAAPEPAAPASEGFPIVTRFDIPRDYGYFIGDEIPLTLIIETAKGTVLDLVNLPHQGEQHGLFEIRNLDLTSTPDAAGGTVYRAVYTLQYFGAAPLTIQFEPLEILYALADGNANAVRVSTYRSLFTQPVTINISRIGPYQPTQALDPKGPLTDTRADLIWLPSLLGATFFLLAIGGWRHQWARQRQRQSLPEPTQTTAVEKALQALRLPAGRFELFNGEMPTASDSLGHIIREYLQAEWNVPAFTLTPAELAAHLPEESEVQSLLDLLQKCDTVKYGPTTDPATERFLWEETLTLFEQLDTRRAS
jgi:hypothetical protein